jgi:hypothetical protein
VSVRLGPLTFDAKFMTVQALSPLAFACSRHCCICGFGG